MNFFKNDNLFSWRINVTHYLIQPEGLPFLNSFLSVFIYSFWLIRHSFLLSVTTLFFC